jgi:hypothetical protein
MTYTAKQIANYIDQNISLTPNSNWTIYDGPNGLTYTKGSMEHRDGDYTVIMSFITMDEAPEEMEDLLYSVEFQLNQHTND